MPASPLERILAHYRVTAQTQKEKGTYFEELIRTYFRFEASYADLYSDVWLFADWAKYQPSKPPALKPKKQLRPHQTTAKIKVGLGFATADRGKLIMSCGTGKTFTSLKIAEEVAGKNKVVRFLVPSLNLPSQSLTEWTQESGLPRHSFAVSSQDCHSLSLSLI